MSTPTRSGQAVRFVTTGEIGITTSEPRKRTPRIDAQLIGRPYAQIFQLDELEVIEITALNTSEVRGRAVVEASDTKVVVSLAPTNPLSISEIQEVADSFTERATHLGFSLDSHPSALKQFVGAQRTHDEPH